MTTSRLRVAVALSPRRRKIVLFTLCLAAFTVTLDTTIVNVTLPTLVRDLNASTRQLQWIVDSYNLVFAALVLAAGSVSDRFGRKGALLTGLGIFVRWERPVAQPMLDVDLFPNLRFSAGSGSVTISFFALFGFIFMVTQ